MHWGAKRCKRNPQVMHGVKRNRCLPETSWLPSSSEGQAVGVCLPLGGRPSEAEVSNPRR